MDYVGQVTKTCIKRFLIMLSKIAKEQKDTYNKWASRE